MKDVHHHVGLAIHQHQMPADYDVFAIGRRRRKPPLEILGTGLNLFA
jgi:hypothetical protein